MKKILCISTLLLLFSTQLAFAASPSDSVKSNDDLEIKKVRDFVATSEQKFKKKKDYLKSQKEFIIQEYNDGRYTITLSDTVDNYEKRALALSKLNAFEAQGSGTLSDSTSTVYAPANYANMGSRFSSDYVDSDNWFGDETISVTGDSAHAIGYSKNPYTNHLPLIKWKSLTEVKDLLTFNYTTVNNVDLGLSVTGPGITLSVSKNSITREIKWVDQSSGDYYHRVIPNAVTLATSDITSFSQLSTGIMTMPNNTSYYITSTKSVSIN